VWSEKGAAGGLREAHPGPGRQVDMGMQGEARAPRATVDFSEGGRSRGDRMRALAAFEVEREAP